jgi:hypothetical protein
MKIKKEREMNVDMKFDEDKDEEDGGDEVEKIQSTFRRGES